MRITRKVPMTIEVEEVVAEVPTILGYSSAPVGPVRGYAFIGGHTHRVQVIAHVVPDYDKQGHLLVVGAFDAEYYKAFELYEDRDALVTLWKASDGDGEGDYDDE